MFSKKKDTRKEYPPVDAYVTAYGSYGFATHIRHRTAEDFNSLNLPALCGRNTVKDGHVVTVEDVRESIPNQHSTFFYCGDCVQQYTGVPADEVRRHRAE